jgi:hypothetical protein
VKNRSEQQEKCKYCDNPVTGKRELCQYHRDMTQALQDWRVENDEEWIGRFANLMRP